MAFAFLFSFKQIDWRFMRQWYRIEPCWSSDTSETNGRVRPKERTEPSCCVRRK